MHKQALISGALLAGVAVILGAFGAHALKEVLDPNQLNTFEVGVRYQFYHSFALLITGIIYQSYPVKQIKLASTFFLIGIALFCGSLYLMTLFNVQGVVGLKGIGAVTPVGGLFFILGWLMLFLGVIKKK
jgi:uncharacterized membrane protein YgdD (TMEM256/DUF423 family)